MGTLYVVATPIGNLSDISPRAIKTLSEVDYILAEDTRNSLQLLNFYNIRKRILSYHKFNEVDKSQKIIDDLNNAKNIALISDAGTPCISDPGYIVVKRARECNMNVIGISGPSAVITALSVSGLDTASFSFYGFFPKEEKYKKKLIEKLKKDSTNIKVVYESPKRIIKLIKRLEEVFPDSILCICKDLSKLFEKTIYGSPKEIKEILNNDEYSEKGEYTVLIQTNYKNINNENSISIEALIIEEMIKNNISLKEASTKIIQEKNINKNIVYKAGINIKNLFINK